MKFLRFSLVMLALIISGSMMAQSQNELKQLMRNRGEYYFTLNVNDPHEIQAISEICSVDGTDGKTVVAYANQKEYDRLLQAGYQPNLQTPPSLRANVTMWDGNGTYNWNAYLTYNQYVSMMEAFPSQAINGRTCTLFSLGTLSTSNHRQLLGVRINNGSPEGKPKFLYTSTMHGDEITGMILMLRLINELCTSTDSQIVDLVNNLDIYIMPLTNPDGTYKGGNNTVNSAQRYNGNNIDLNRNYKDYYQGVHPDGNAYEDETIWTMAFGDENLFTMSANYHGGAEVMNYPWDATYDDHVDKDWYEYVCTEYVQVARQTYNSYMSDTYSDGVTSGAAWYVITGSRQDYMNSYAQCREVTVECSTTKTPAANQLPNFWNYNRNSMLAFMEQANNGVHGFVYDAVTNEPIQGVSVTVENHDNETSFVTSHSIGDFHRPIKGGTYTFTFAKQGYYPESVQVTVADDGRQDLTVYLNPNLNLTPDFTASTTNASLGQDISFTDTSEGMVSSWEWTFEGATPSTSTEQNPTGITYDTPGDYDVTLVITGPTGTTATKTKENYIHVTESILMQNGSVTACSGTFYDSGGADGQYTNNLDYTMTFYPATEGAMLSITFSQFETESGYDYLYIYDGTSTSATQIGKYSGTTSPGTVTATNASGALTFRFTSDGSQVKAGWVAELSCVVVEHTITATANPSEGGTIEGAGTYVQGTTCTLTATAAENYQFLRWTENGEEVSTEATYAFQVTTDRTLVAVFGSTIPVNITVSANPARGGSVSGGGEFLIGETCTVTAEANNNYIFTNWTENETVVSENASYTFTVTSGRDLVAHFIFDADVPGNCYYPVSNTEVAAGNYVMCYLNGTTLSTLSQGSNNAVSASSTTVTLTDFGFSVDEATTLPEITLTEYQSGQYYISYNGQYLARSNMGGSLTWTTNQNNGRWHIDSNGIYMTVNYRTYYLYYNNNNGSFALSTTAQNNISFYTSGDCPVPEFNITATVQPEGAGTVEGADLYYLGETCTLTATANEGYTFVNWTENGEEVSTDATYSFEVTTERSLVAHFEADASTATQTCTLQAGWNWWSTYLNISLEELEEALDGKCTQIVAQNGSIGYLEGYGWDGDFTSIDPARMYKFYMTESMELVLNGTVINPADYAVTLQPNSTTWIGFPEPQEMTFGQAFANFSPTPGDVVKGANGTVTYLGGIYWSGAFDKLEPGKGYVYKSKATTTKTLEFPSANSNTEINNK